jgi:hypothetical protein
LYLILLLIILYGLFATFFSRVVTLLNRFVSSLILGILYKCTQMERREEVYGSQSQAAPSHAAPPGAGRFPVEVALAEDAGGQSEPLDPPQNFHGMTSAAELARIEAETVLINILKPYNED